MDTLENLAKVDSSVLDVMLALCLWILPSLCHSYTECSSSVNGDESS